MKSTSEDGYSSSEFFSPPLWRQRRTFIQEILNQHNIETVIDYGCGEAAVLSFLISATENKLTKIAGIDIDSEVLEEAVDRCLPYKSDFEQLWPRLLVIDIYQGSVGVADDRLKNYQAIVCSEVIEHVEPNVLDAFLDLTLGVYHPEILLVTTPNGEYNVNFPDLKYNTPESIFRHDDHKFEWTRKEFKSWCEAGAKKYSYNTEYHGIGLLHHKYDQLENGHCTQACVFTRSKDSVSPLSDQTHGTPHRLLKHIEFPYYNEETPPRDKIMEELDYYIEALCKADNYMNQEPAKGYPMQEAKLQQQQHTDLDITVIDWESFDMSKYDTLQAEQPTPNVYTTTSSSPHTPIHISISSLWSILRLQHICGAQENMVDILKSADKNYYQITDGDTTLVVSKSFDWEQEDGESVKSFSSTEEW
ncbi:small RNA 2'-O-methyltransferase [Mucor ambiguus]|uniref:Small RNA 2'-O-methyltransferase n=1 Tax=Mucor ambiguus TaxID=91626 RepID=A0A0C9LRP1_9FUNG|nr:small RNA 2'-O-methyltransferase [Mucor ambiguus]